MEVCGMRQPILTQKTIFSLRLLSSQHLRKKNHPSGRNADRKAAQSSGPTVVNLKTCVDIAFSIDAIPEVKQKRNNLKSPHVW